LDRRDDDVDPLRCAVERGGVGEVAFDQLGAAVEQRLELGVGFGADKQADACLRPLEQVGDPDLTVRAKVISRRKLDRAFRNWNDAACSISPTSAPSPGSPT